MLEAISESAECNLLSLDDQNHDDDTLMKETQPLLDEISQNLPFNNDDLRNAVVETKEKLSANGKLSLSMIIAELKKECDRLDHINSEMRNKSQIRSEKKINKLSKLQAGANRNKGYTSIVQMVALGAIVVFVGRHFPDDAQAQQRYTELFSQFSNHIGNAATNYFEGENLRLGSKGQLEQAKYTESNQKAQASEGGKQDRGRMLTEILQNSLSAARSG